VEPVTDVAGGVVVGCALEVTDLEAHQLGLGEDLGRVELLLERDPGVVVKRPVGPRGRAHLTSSDQRTSSQIHGGKPASDTNSGGRFGHVRKARAGAGQDLSAAGRRTRPHGLKIPSTLGSVSVLSDTAGGKKSSLTLPCGVVPAASASPYAAASSMPGSQRHEHERAQRQVEDERDQHPPVAHAA
jgi:hypothetical protein